MKTVSVYFVLYHKASKTEIIMPEMSICSEYSHLAFSTRKGDYNDAYNGIDRLPSDFDESTKQYDIYMVVNGEKFIVKNNNE